MSENDTFKPVFYLVCDLAFIDPDNTLHSFFRFGAKDTRFQYKILRVHSKSRVIHLSYVPGKTMHTIPQLRALAKACTLFFNQNRGVKK